MPDEVADEGDDADVDDGANLGDDADARISATVATLPKAGRIGASTRYARSIQASGAAFPSGADTVVISNGTDAGGTTIAGIMAGGRGAPLLLASYNSVSSALATELRRLAPERIVLVGAKGKIGADLRAALTRMAPVERVFLTSRYQGTRVALGAAAPVDTVYLASSLRDLSAASGAAAATGRAVLAVPGTASRADSTTVKALRAAGATRLIAVGGSSSIRSSYAQSLKDAGFTVTRIAGEDEYERSLALAGQDRSPDRVYIANPKVVWDVAVASALAGATGQPIAYTPHQCMRTPTASFISRVGAGVVAIGSSTYLRSAVVTNTACSVQKPRLAAELADDIRAVTAKYSGSYAVSVREVGGAVEQLHMRGDTRLEPASMMKLYAAWAALRWVQNGRATLSTKPGPVTLGTCLRVMIHASDNSCHTDIVHWIGISSLNKLLAAKGFTDTRYGSVSKGTSVLYAGNRTSTSDLARFMLMLESGQLLDEKYSDLLLKYMHQQIWTSRIASGIPSSATQYSKPGSLWLSGGLLQADTALIRGPRSTYVLSIIGTGRADKAALRGISRVVYTHFNGSFGAAASYPVKQMITSGRVAVRTSPGGSITAYVAKGTLIEVTDANRYWYKVRYGSRELWIDSRLLRNR